MRKAVSHPGANPAEAAGRIERIDAAQAFETLRAEPGARLVDVRTRAEWSFVGLPALDAIGRPLWAIEWKNFPEMSPNPRFYEQLSGQIEADRARGDAPTALLFICRSGARSLDAAFGAASRAEFEALRLANVEDGFEGDLDGDRQRGRLNGWKAAGLPWRQS